MTMWEQTQQIFMQLFERAAAAATRVLPGLFAAALVLLLCALAGLLLRGATRRFLRRIDFDKKMREWGLARADSEAPAAGPSDWAGRLVLWAALALGFLGGLSVLDAVATQALSVQLVAYIPKVLTAAVLFILGAAAGRYLERSVLIGAVNIGLRSARLLATGVRWLLLVLGTAMALGHLEIGGQIVTLAFGILFGGIVLALALAVGLGAREVVGRSLEKRFPAPDAAPPVEEKQAELEHL
jgi:hypothetical protein